jgi:hypothetical protein
MFDNMQTGGMEDVSEDELSLAMGAAPAKKAATKKPAPAEATPSTKKGPKAGKDASESAKKKSISNASSSVLTTAFTTSADEEDNEEADDEPQGFVPEEEEEEEETPKPKAKKAKAKTEVLDTEEEEEENETPDEDEDPDADGSETPEEEEEQEEETGNITVGNFLKARVDLLLKKGEWLPWEGMKDDDEWTEDAFAEMEVNQREFQRTKMREDILTSFGPYGRKISEFSETGGDPDELISIFQEEQRAQALSVDTEEQQRDVVFKYETEFLNKKGANVKRYIDTLVADKALAEEAKEAKEKMEQYWKSEGDDLIASQAEILKQQKAQEAKSRTDFSNSMTKLITDNKGISEDEKKTLIRTLTKFDKKLANGQTVNEFYQKFADFRKNPSDYIDLVRFVLDKNKFMKSLKNEGKNESIEKSFSLIRGSNKIKKSKSSETTTSTGKGKKSGFKLMY